MTALGAFFDFGFDASVTAPRHHYHRHHKHYGAHPRSPGAITGHRSDPHDLMQYYYLAPFLRRESNHSKQTSDDSDIGREWDSQSYASGIRRDYEDSHADPHWHPSASVASKTRPTRRRVGKRLRSDGKHGSTARPIRTIHEAAHLQEQLQNDNDAGDVWYSPAAVSAGASDRDVTSNTMVTIDPQSHSIYDDSLSASSSQNAGDDTDMQSILVATPAVPSPYDAKPRAATTSGEYGELSPEMAAKTIQRAWARYRNMCEGRILIDGLSAIRDLNARLTDITLQYHNGEI